MQKSESVINIAKALSAFQAEVENPKNTASNPFFKSKYAPLPDILNIARPIMAKHGLSIIQSPSSADGEKIVITTLLLHSSGEWIETCPLILKADKITAQGAGSAITYGRRYALSAVLGISSEDDDDGNHASKPEEQSQGAGQKQSSKQEAKPTNKPQYETGDKCSEAQQKAIYAISKSKKIDIAPLLKKHGVSSTKDLTKKQASETIEELNKAELRTA